jgi:hypothetical protein
LQREDWAHPLQRIQRSGSASSLWTYPELCHMITHPVGVTVSVAEPPIWQGLAHATPKFKNSS